jgi:hypothetical protein
MAKKKIRILVAVPIGQGFCQCNDIINIDASIARPFLKDGLADDDQGGIDYCLAELGKTVIEHESVVEEPALVEPKPEGAVVEITPAADDQTATPVADEAPVTP